MRTLLRAYVAMPETPTRCHSNHRRIALELYRRGIPVEVIETALVLGSARRLSRDRQRSVSPIRCLAYFIPVIEEVIADPHKPNSLTEQFSAKALHDWDLALLAN